MSEQEEFQLSCNECGKKVSSKFYYPSSEQFVFRAYAQCPECIDIEREQNERIRVLEARYERQCWIGQRLVDTGKVTVDQVELLQMQYERENPHWADCIRG